MGTNSFKGKSVAKDRVHYILTKALIHYEEIILKIIMYNIKYVSTNLNTKKKLTTYYHSRRLAWISIAFSVIDRLSKNK